MFTSSWTSTTTLKERNKVSTITWYYIIGASNTPKNCSLVTMNVNLALLFATQTLTMENWRCYSVVCSVLNGHKALGWIPNIKSLKEKLILAMATLIQTLCSEVWTLFLIVIKWEIQSVRKLPSNQRAWSFILVVWVSLEIQNVPSHREAP